MVHLSVSYTYFFVFNVFNVFNVGKDVSVSESDSPLPFRMFLYR